MREFAHIDLNNIHLRSLSSLREVRAKLLAHFSQNYDTQNYDKSEQLISYLKNYVDSKNNRPTDLDEKLATLIPYLPKDSDLVGFNNVNMRLLILKLVFRQHGFPNDSICELSYAQRLAAVIKLRRKICLHDDWAYEVDKICSYLDYKNLELAQSKMREIIDLNKQTHSKQEKALNYALQIIYCINIIEFVNGIGLKSDYATVYNLALQTLDITVEKLKKLNINQSNCILFAWNTLITSNHAKVKVTPHSEESRVQYLATARFR